MRQIRRGQLKQRQHAPRMRQLAAKQQQHDATVHIRRIQPAAQAIVAVAFGQPDIGGKLFMQ